MQCIPPPVMYSFRVLYTSLRLRYAPIPSATGLFYHYAFGYVPYVLNPVGYQSRFLKTKNDNPNETNKKRKPTSNRTSYSNMTIAQAEERLNIRLNEVPLISLDEILATAKHTVKKADVEAMKESFMNG